LDQFNRRAREGQCFHRPYLGCREFACDFELLDTTTPPSRRDSGTTDRPYYGTDEASRDLGYMLHDIDFARGRTARFFRAQMVRGVIHVPHPDSDEVRG
jgi:CRISPR-associated protein Cas5d